MGESEKQVSILFQRARDAAPSIIFIDELIPYVVHEVRTMRMKHLDEWKQNFLYECR